MRQLCEPGSDPQGLSGEELQAVWHGAYGSSGARLVKLQDSKTGLTYQVPQCPVEGVVVARGVAKGSAGGEQEGAVVHELASCAMGFVYNSMLPRMLP